MNSPRELFLKLHKEDAAKLEIVVSESWFLKSVIYARAQLSADGISSEQLNGVNRFIEVFTAMATEDKPAPTLPDKSQLKSYK